MTEPRTTEPRTIEHRVYPYEIMFLASQGVAADLNGLVAHINEIFARNKGEVISMRKWDERRLAYEIAKQKRGYYILVYAKMPGASLHHFERDCNLSEKIMRTMILRCDHLSEDEVRAADGRDALVAEARLRGREMAQGVEGQPAPTEQPAEAAAG
jgi:small subunit ribosomal protein S6